MKNTTLIAVIIFTFCACSKVPKKALTPPSGPASVFSRLFPGIDTATLWHYGVGKPTSAHATVNASGDMVITTFDTFSGGSYKIVLVDTDATPGVKEFNLVRSGPDTIISTGNGIGILTADNGRKYYWMQIDGGALPVKGIVRGQFIDSI